MRATLSASIALAACSSDKPSVQAEAAGAVPSATGNATVDACLLVTQEEAATLFREAATRGKGSLVTDPAMVGECLWEHDEQTRNHLLQVRVWGSPQYYASPGDEFTSAFDLGEKAYLRAHPGAGVDIVWVQGGRTIEVSYSTVGSTGDPRAIDHVDEVKQLARQASGRL